MRGERGQREAWAADHGATALARAQPERSHAQCSEVGGRRGDVEMHGRERPVAEHVRTEWRGAQSSKSPGSDESNTNTGIRSAWVGSKAGVWPEEEVSFRGLPK